MFPTPKNKCNFFNKIKSFICKLILNSGWTPHPILLVLFLYILRLKHDSASANPVTQ